ncbi:hypothetical protein DH2020_023492 [Rehmannia glutinosa]|uniref:A20-type domain-containing protein n=1 Tax=Rehmannia glutinosa TaxID=99300 RepID=A0ABR0WA04_REHGL
MEQNETGCQTPQAPILCVNNCGFFGTAVTMNMCSKCYKDVVMKQGEAELAASSFQSIMNGSSSTAEKDYSDVAVVVKAKAKTVSSEVLVASTQTSAPPVSEKGEEIREGPKRCGTCRKRVGLTGFNCRCGSIFCITSIATLTNMSALRLSEEVVISLNGKIHQCVIGLR